MNSTTLPISFRKMEEGDLPLFYAWSKKNHLKEAWFPDDDESLDHISEKIAGNGYVYPFIILSGDFSIGYIQYTDLFAYKTLCTKLSGVFTNELSGSYNIDIFIAEEEFLDKGYGTLILKQFCSFLFSKPEVEKLLIDPNIQNKRAIRCYEKAGFTPIKEACDGPERFQIMEQKRPINMPVNGK